MTQRIGRLTLALALIAGGAAFLADNLLATDFAALLARLWPALLILLGLEWLVFSAIAHTDGHHVKSDGGAVFLLIVVVIVAMSINGWRSWAPRFNWSPVRHVNVEVGPIPPVSFSPLGQVPGEAVLTEELDLSQAQALMVNAQSASITVQDGEKPRVELRVRTWSRTQQEAEDLARQTLLNVTPGPTVNVSAQHSVNGRFEDQFIITLPKATALSLRTTTQSGSIAIADRTGTVSAESSSGSVRIERVNGDVDVRASSGSITVGWVTGDVKANSSSGGVKVEHIAGNAQLNSTSGSVTVAAVSGKLSAQASSGSVNVSGSAVGGDYDLGAVSGSVRLVIPSTADVNVTARATSGSVTGPDWLIIGEGRNSGTGTQGSGQYDVAIRTSSGSISIENNDGLR